MRRFDTEAAVRQWLAQVEVRTDIALESVDELEAHLASSVDELRAGGLTEEEAFLVATRRLGDLDALCVEFGKVEGGARAWESALAVLLGFLLLSALSFLVGQIVLWTTIACGLEWGARPDYAFWGAIGATVWTAMGLVAFWALAGPSGTRWRRAVDGFRRLGLRSQALIVLAVVVTIPLSSLLLHHLASRLAPPATFGLVGLVNGYGSTAFRFVLVPALALWLLVRLKRPGAAVGLAVDQART